MKGQVTNCSLAVRLIAGYHQIPIFLIGAMMNPVRSILCLTVLTLLAGCDPLTLTALGVGAGAGINHTMNGYTYHTFSEPLPRVKQAALVALNRMSIKVESSEKDGVFETITAKSSGRSVELELEVISPNSPLKYPTILMLLSLLSVFQKGHLA